MAGGGQEEGLPPTGLVGGEHHLSCLLLIVIWFLGLM